MAEETAKEQAAAEIDWRSPRVWRVYGVAALIFGFVLYAALLAGHIATEASVSLGYEGGSWTAPIAQWVAVISILAVGYLATRRQFVGKREDVKRADLPYGAGSSAAVALWALLLSLVAVAYPLGRHWLTGVSTFHVEYYFIVAIIPGMAAWHIFGCALQRAADQEANHDPEYTRTAA